MLDDTDDAPQLNLESALTRAVNATADDEGWSSVSAIGNHLSRTQASFDPRNFGHAKLSSLVSAQPYLESLTEGRQILVRLKGKPAKAPQPRHRRTRPTRPLTRRRRRRTEAAPAKAAATEKAPAGKASAQKAETATAPKKTATRKTTARKTAAEKTAGPRRPRSRRSPRRSPGRRPPSRP